MLFIETWIDPEPRDRHTKPEKDKYHIISLICEIKKKKRTYLQNRNRPTDIESKVIFTKGKEDEIDKLGDQNYHINTTIYIINNLS